MHSHETLCIQSDIRLCVFSSWTCAGISCVMCEPYDSYLSNGSTLTHYLGFKSDHSMNTREKSSWCYSPNFLFALEIKQQLWDALHVEFHFYLSWSVVQTQNISTTIGQIPMKFSKDIHVSHRINCNNFSDLLTFQYFSLWLNTWRISNISNGSRHSRRTFVIYTTWVLDISQIQVLVGAHSLV